MPFTFSGACDGDDNLFSRQHFLDYLTPFDRYYYMRIIDELGQLRCDDSRFLQPVKIKVYERQFTRMIFPADSKRRAGDVISTAHTFCQTADKGRLPATQVTDQNDDLSALKLLPD